MRVLVTGATGLVGSAAVRALLAAGCSVRLFARHATTEGVRFKKEGQEAGSNVELRDGSIASPLDVSGLAADCDAVLHTAGIAEESGPEATFELVNVGGTDHLLAEAERAGVRRFVYVSSLGADRGASAYHASKRQAETLVRGFSREWVVCRPGNIYGPGDEVISMLLQIVRSSPVAPVIDSGDQPFQPLWADDLGKALAEAVARPGLAGRTLLLAGPEVTTTNDLIDRLARLTGKEPLRLPVPSPLAALGAQAAALLGIRPPVTEDKLVMLQEGNVIPAGEPNGVLELGVTPLALDEGLRRLLTGQPEQLPRAGEDRLGGPLMRRLYRAHLGGVRRQRRELFQDFHRRFFEFVPEATVRPVGAAAQKPLETGATLTLSLPLRGEVQVRVAEVSDESLTLVTVAGHPLAGTNTFRFTGDPERGLHFQVETVDRAATPLDQLTMFPLGNFLKGWTWQTVVQRTAEAMGALRPVRVETSEEALTGEEERKAVDAMQRMVAAI
jgi:NADH dehydrogenase